MNEALRAHVTRVGFDLTLTKTQMAALVWVVESVSVGQYLRATPSDNRRFGFSHLVTGLRGLQDRGLVEHIYPTPERRHAYRKRTGRDLPPARTYKVTRAGRLAVGLLREAGMYDEIAAALHPYLQAVS